MFVSVLKADRLKQMIMRFVSLANRAWELWCILPIIRHISNVEILLGFGEVCQRNVKQWVECMNECVNKKKKNVCVCVRLWLIIKSLNKDIKKETLKKIKVVVFVFWKTTLEFFGDQKIALTKKGIKRR